MLVQSSKHRTGNKMFSMNRYILLFILVLSEIGGFSQSVHTNTSDSSAKFPKKYGTFEHYAFVLNGKVIGQEALVNNLQAQLNNIFPYPLTLEGQSYPGAVYFHSEQRFAPPVGYADQPAYFINGRQVSPYQIRLTKMEAYNHISKSTQDTIIDGTQYRGSVHVDSDEDFFADRISLPDFIEKYTDLSPEEVIIHWRNTQDEYRNEDDIGTIIGNHFPLYSFKIRDLSVNKIEVDRVRFAERERYVIHIHDDSYRQSLPKGTLIFEDPLDLNTVYPCYLSDFDPKDEQIFIRPEVDASTYKGLSFYLKKLSSTTGIPLAKPSSTTKTDSITVQFIVLKDGMITALESADLDKPGHEVILTAFKKNACGWTPAVQGGRPVLCRRKMVLFYSKDQKGDIRSLDSLKYR